MGPLQSSSKKLVGFKIGSNVIDGEGVVDRIDETKSH